MDIGNRFPPYGPPRATADQSLAGHQVKAAGLATGGGTLDKDPTITVTAATISEAQAGTGGGVLTASLGASAVAAQRPFADQTSAEAGVDAASVLSPLRGKQGVRAYVKSLQTYVVNDLSDGSGSAANDDAAIGAAITAGLASGGRVLFTRPFKWTTERTINAPLTIEGTDVHECYMTAQAALRSFLNVTTGFVEISRLFLDATVSGYGAGIRVEKGFDDSWVKIRDIDLSYCTDGVAWVDGDLPFISNIRAVNGSVALNFYNNGTNGQVRELYALGCQGLKIRRNASATVPQQMEGTDFFGIRVLPALNTVPFGVEIRAGLALRFHSLMVDQVKGGTALHIQGGASVPVDDVVISGLWLGTGASPLSTTRGMDVEGGARRIHVHGGQIIGFPNYGAVLNGSSTLTQNNNSFSNVKFTGNSCDLFASYVTGMLLNNEFLSNTPGQGVYEVTNTEIVGLGNYFEIGPQLIGAKSSYLLSRGPGAFTGIPLSSAGLTAGKLWDDAGVVKVI